MLTTTDGIILRTIKYGESSIIADILTADFGLRTYMMNGVRSAKKSKASLFQIMNHVEITVYHRLEKEINRIKEIRLSTVYQTIPFNIVKSSIGQFITECTLLSLKGNEASETIFESLLLHFSALDIAESNYNTTHILYLAKLISLLGLTPELNYSPQNNFLSIKEGRFYSIEQPLGCSADVSNDFHNLFTKEDSTSSLDYNNRQALLKELIRYLDYHIESFKTPNSYIILKEVLS